MPAIMELIRELAIYEKALAEVEITSADLTDAAFGNHDIIATLVAESSDEIVGAMIFYDVFSTWKGRSLYLEDFVISENFRRNGIGSLLFDALKDEARRRGSSKIMWQVLDWNEPAIKFYEKLGCNFEKEWIDCTLTIR